MYILTSDKRELINLDHVEEIYVDENKMQLIVAFANGDDLWTGDYQSKEHTKKALEMLAENIGKKDMFKMPTNEEVCKQFAKTEIRVHYTSERATKGERKRYGILQKNAKHKTK